VLLLLLLVAIAAVVLLAPYHFMDVKYQETRIPK